MLPGEWYDKMAPVTVYASNATRGKDGVRLETRESSRDSCRSGRRQQENGMGGCVSRALCTGYAGTTSIVIVIGIDFLRFSVR